MITQREQFYSNPEAQAELAAGYDCLARAGITGAKAGMELRRNYKLHIMRHLLEEIQVNFKDALRYTLPRFKLTDHLKDCYGWHKPMKKASCPYTKLMVKAFADKINTEDVLS